MNIDQQLATLYMILGNLARTVFFLESLASLGTPNSISISDSKEVTSSTLSKALVTKLKLIAILIDITGTGVVVGRITGATDSIARLGNPEGVRLGLSLGISLPDEVPPVGTMLGRSLGSDVFVAPPDGVTVGKGVAEDVGLLVGVAVVTIVGLGVDSGATGQNSRSGGPRSLCNQKMRAAETDEYISKGRARVKLSPTIMHFLRSASIQHFDLPATQDMYRSC
jgi:hypothetical protein